jgi:peptidoglycan/LPS O-acetylase OafA/YrhL
VLVVLDSTGLSPNRIAVIGFALTFGLAIVSYTLVERPAQRAIRARFARA